MANRLWAGGEDQLWYSDDGGSTWTQITPIPGASDIEGLWGPTNAPKIYTVVDAIGLYSWEEGVGWVQELANVNAAGGFGWVAQLSQFWCADDDSAAYTTGIGPVRSVWSRQGPPGSAWAPCTVGVTNVADVHGSPDGSEVFAVEFPAFFNWTLYRHAGGGIFASVHAFGGVTAIYQVRVVSAAEVRLFGITGNIVQVWLWNGAVRSLEYSFDVSSLGGVFASWAGAWMSADGQDGGVAVNCSGAVQGVYLRRTAGVWALDDGDIQSARPMTRSAGIQGADDDRLLFTQGRFQRRSGGLWVDAGWEPIGTWADSLPDGYNLWWQELAGGGGGGVSPEVIGEDGGYELTLTGTFPVGASLEVFLGPAGDETDPPCYGGRGYGYNPVSADGASLSVVSPPIAPGAGYSLSWRQVGGGAPEVIASLTVLERNWSTKEFLMRGNFPPWTGLGARILDREPLRKP